MKKYFAALAAGLVAMLGVGVAAPAQAAYPEPTFTLSLSATTVVSGGTFTASVKADTTCTFTIDFNGASKSGAGTSFSNTFTAPTVSKKTVLPLTATCDTAVAAGRGMASVKTEVFTRSVNVTVLPAASSGSGSTGGGSTMPNTGGPNEWLLIGGLALLAAGAGTVVATRRRSQA